MCCALKTRTWSVPRPRLDWLGLDADEGPFYQMQRMDRYRQLLDEMLADGRAYYCYATPEELEAMREAQRARGEKPRYDGRWRPENAAGKQPPADVKPVVRMTAWWCGTTWSRGASPSAMPSWTTW